MVHEEGDGPTYVCKGRAQEYCNRTWDCRVTVSPRTGDAGDSMDECPDDPSTTLRDAM